jgi:hypothetical protein
MLTKCQIAETELHGLAKVLIENFLVNTKTNWLITFPSGHYENRKEKEYRRITERPDTPKRIYKSHTHHGQLFDKLKQFIFRKVAVLKIDQENQGEYVDIEKILSKGEIAIDDKFKGVLGIF